jgi:CBS domain-containing protein
MKARDIMVSKVITARPDQSVQEIAAALLQHRISGMPVVDAAGALVGIVSEGDLMRRAEAGTEHRRSWWLRMLMGRHGLAAEYIREHSRRIEDVMTRDVVTTGPDTSIADIADLLERHGIKRVPIMQEDKLVGIVSRANLLQALAGMRVQAPVESAATDAALRDAVMKRLNAEPWTKMSMVSVTVHDGTVELSGFVDSPVEKKALVVAVQTTPGVGAVKDNVVVQPTPLFGTA